MIDLTQKALLRTGQHLRILLIVASLMFFFSALGILSRPFDLLSYFWPANAVLLGILLRFPHLHSVSGWLGAFIGFLTANIGLNGGIEINVYMTIANLITVSVSLTLIDLLKLNYQRYQQGVQDLYLIVLSVLVGSMMGSAFAILTIPHLENTFLPGHQLWLDFAMWWSAEMINMITFLPVVLALPNKEIFQRYWHDQRRITWDWMTVFPFLGVIVSLFFANVYFGTGALLFPSAALIWSALTYPIFFVALINCLVCMTLYYSANLHYLSQSAELYLAHSISIRVGLCMLALGPLTLSILSANRKALYKQVLYLANHDSLTQAMTRRYFLEEADRILYSPIVRPRSISILLMDLDFFKNINDQYGHHVGDMVLKKFSTIVKNSLREEDLFGRLGGEEFAILLTNISAAQSVQIAERIRNAVEQASFQLEDGSTLTISVSIGVHYQPAPFYPYFTRLLQAADVALYRAKANGRNQIYMEPKSSSI
ncbi:GGDEF domain-containing protein [Acinetobacter sp. CAAS 2-6]|uniref:GGDEF domain-containing protein n=1 Tax=Acinetobacter sp. CAAS 2-6 TaxID=3016358 RepID=UPI002DD61C17|nr:diguanylate cyclase [Acinetobacter sp. CAAS 2-6]